MPWIRTAEGPDERTEIFEISDRGCLVRVVVRSADSRWITASVAFCPGLRPADLAEALGGSAAEPAAPAPPPEPAVAPAAQPAAAEPPPSPAPEAAATPAAAAPEPAPAPAPTPAPAPAIQADPLIDVVREYAAMRAAVIAVFRSKVGVSSGPLGFLDNVPQVGSFSAPGHGDWIWRLDPNVATLTSKKNILQLPLPDHARDDGFDADSLAAYLKVTNRQALAHEGATHPVDAATLSKLIRRLEEAKLVRLYSAHPKPLYIVK